MSNTLKVSEVSLDKVYMTRVKYNSKNIPWVPCKFTGQIKTNQNGHEVGIFKLASGASAEAYIRDGEFKDSMSPSVKPISKNYLKTARAKIENIIAQEQLKLNELTAFLG
jgi:hypothetical protein